jgi:DNA-binding CsgD family transcriptional regulator
MTASFAGTVLFGDVVDSRSDPESTAWLRSLCVELEAAYPREQRLASFAFTQGDELQGLLAPDADPFRAILLAALRPDARELRWAVVAGDVDPGSGPAVERTGRAFFAARESIARARAHRDGLVALTGDLSADERLADLGPLLAALLADLTPRQREVARLILVDDRRRSEVADQLGVSRATVSVIADRARVRHLARLARSLAAIFAEGAARAREGRVDEATVQ